MQSAHLIRVRDWSRTLIAFVSLSLLVTACATGEEGAASDEPTTPATQDAASSENGGEGLSNQLAGIDLDADYCGIITQMRESLVIPDQPPADPDEVASVAASGVCPRAFRLRSMK